jgi:hypothetical protein
LSEVLNQFFLGLVAAWHPLDFEQMKATPIAIPGKEGRTCPPMT